MLAKDFFREAFADLDIATADLAEMSRDGRERWLLELEDRIASLHDISPDEEDPSLGTEISILRIAGRRAPYTSEPSRLPRGYLRRALGQLWRIEQDRGRGDYRDVISDRMFALAVGRQNAPSFAGPDPEEAKQGASSLGQCVERFQAEVPDIRDLTPKTELKHQASLQFVTTFFGRETLVSDIERADCTRFRDTLAKLPPNFSKRQPDRPLAEIASGHSGQTLAWETQSTYC